MGCRARPATCCPPIFLCVGALDWSLWSGMEVALFLGLWSLAVVAWDDLCLAADKAGPAGRGGGGAARCKRSVAVRDAAGRHRRTVRAGGQRAPEAAPANAPAPLAAGRAVGRARRCLAARARRGESLAHRRLDGRGRPGQAGNAPPVPDARRGHRRVVFHFKYQVLRVTQYHFSDVWCWVGAPG